MQMVTHNLEEFKNEAIRFIRGTTPHQSEATIVVLSGDLGSGKTTFVQDVAHFLGVTERVASPTFTLMKMYDLPEGAVWKQMIHIDAYRLTDDEGLSVLEWETIRHESGNLIMIEWPEQVPSHIPNDAISVRIEADGEERTITYANNKYRSLGQSPKDLY